MTQEALKLALDALGNTWTKVGTKQYEIEKEAITAIKKALAQPEQEPVKMIAYNCTCGKTMKFESVNGVTPPQRTWVGLTHEERQDIALEVPIDALLITEAKLKQQNGYAEEKNT